MGKLILITGGARSGKSSFAEETAKSFGSNILYCATSIAFDEEMKDRIKRHRERRPCEWETVEAYRDLDVALGRRLAGKDAVLLDCITIMVSNLMLERSMDWEGAGVDEIGSAEERTGLEIEKLLKLAASAEIPFIAVTNELGMGVVPPTVLGRAIRDIGGRANQALAKAAAEVYLCISGIPVKIK
jgi:adenosylcobinamide kinase/adenosylcobinamide-phosphate guanylyltransferase